MKKTTINYMMLGFGNSNQIGGSTTRSIEIIKRLLNKDITVDIITTSSGKSACITEGLDTNFFVIKSNIPYLKKEGMVNRFLANLRSTIHILTKLNKVPKCQMIFSDSDWFCEVIPAFFIKRNNNCKWIVMIHHESSIFFNSIKSFAATCFSSLIQKLSFLLFLKKTDKILVLGTKMGEKIRDKLISLKYPENKISYVLNGVDLNRYTSSASDNSDEKKEYDAIFVGGLRPNKGLYDIVPIWEKIFKERPSAKLVLIGSCSRPYHNYLVNEIKRKGLEKNILLVGFVKKRDDVIDYLNKSSLYFFPSREEGFGISILEAMSCGLPVIAWDLDVYHNIFDKGIIKIKKFNQSDFSKETIKLLNDVSLLNSLARESIQLAEKYNWDNIAKEEYKIIKSLINEGSIMTGAI